MLAIALRFALQFGANQLKTVTGDTLDRAIDAVLPIFLDMLLEGGEITAETRQTYEFKALRVLRELNIIKAI